MNGYKIENILKLLGYFAMKNWQLNKRKKKPIMKMHMHSIRAFNHEGKQSGKWLNIKTIVWIGKMDNKIWDRMVKSTVIFASDNHYLANHHHVFITTAHLLIRRDVVEDDRKKK
jgi:hypothetical protein